MAAQIAVWHIKIFNIDTPVENIKLDATVAQKPPKLASKAKDIEWSRLSSQ